MANSELKLIYFNIPGRAEVSRLVLVAAGKQFEDYRVSGETWRGEIKPTTPFDNCPVLEINGKQYGQSRAISAFLANEFGLYGQTNIDKLKIDQTSQLMEDFFLEYGSRYYFETDKTKKAEGEKHLKEVTAPKFLGIFEQMLQENGSGHIVGDNLTLADIVVFDMATGFLSPIVKDSLESFPMLKSLVEKVGNVERIKSYMDTRQDKKAV